MRRGRIPTLSLRRLPVSIAPDTTRHTASAKPSLGPLQMSEIILHTKNFEAMRTWYRRLFDDVQPATDVDSEKKLSFLPQVDRICFLRIHTQYPYTQVLGLFEIRDLAPPGKPVPGLDHMQFREASLSNLFSRYEALKAADVMPFSTYNHGPGSSFYYRDPDDNVVEISAVNFDTEREYLAFFQTEAFKRNIAGHPVDADEYIREYRLRHR